MASPRTRQRTPAAAASSVLAMTRVEVLCQYTVERYDAAGRVLDASQPQTVKVVAMSPEALGEALAQLAQQLAGVWTPAQAPAAPTTPSGDEG